MSLVCPHCLRKLEFAGPRPTFCGYCGERLGSGSVTVEDAIEPPTLSPPPPAETEIVSLAPPMSVAKENVPEAIGSYQLIRRLGGGGMGAVYEAVDIASGRRVALKLVQPEHAASPDAIERFRREGELASKLSHPRCVFVLAADEVGGRPYIVMELMTGVTLADLVKQHGPLPLEQALRKILDVIEGLHEAHQHGLIHRDVKPSNCFVEENGRVKVGDFGLAKSLLQPAHLTRTGTFVGTPLFAAPEQIKMEAVDVRSDVYSVAATLYFLLTGRAPFQTADATATLARIMGDAAPSMRTLRPELPKALDKVVLRGLERDRRRRWRSLDEFRQALALQLPAEPTVGGLGLRFVAYVLDLIAFSVPELAAKPLLNPHFAPGPGRVLVENAISLILGLAYFGILEGVWGRALGKRLLRLHVGLATVNQPPGIGRALVRAATLYLFLTLVFAAGEFYAAANLPPSLEGSATPARQEIKTPVIVAFVPLLLYVLGVGCVVSTMRKHNGYRGLHEFLSGTRTYRLHWPQATKRRLVTASDIQLPSEQPAGIPEQIGPYRIRGALRWTSEEQTLLGDDAQLSRTVWLWMHPDTAPPLGEARRSINRLTRLRWVSCGAVAGQHWDAFLAPSGRPLSAHVSDAGRLSWAEFRGVLEDLTDELQAACAAGALPTVLTPGQVWVNSQGRALLLDMPLGNAVADAAPGQSALDDESRAFAFLGEVAVLALEGPGRAGKTAQIRAPLPLHAAENLKRLFDAIDEPPTSPAIPFERLERFHGDLLASQMEPVEVTRRMRAEHLLFHGMCIFFAGLVALISLGLLMIHLEDPDQPGGGSAGTIATRLTAAVFLIAFLLTAYLTRGGVSFIEAGIAIVRADGSRASGLRCVCRSLLSWGFVALVAGLVVVGIAIATRLRQPVLGLAPFLLGGAVLVLYLTLMLWKPARAPHDWLAGTYLVPK